MILRALGLLGSDTRILPRCVRPEPPIQATQGMSNVRTSHNDPIRIDAVSPGDGSGRIGITLCPGKKDAHAWSGPADRDLGLDLDEVQRWGATAVMSLITDEEIDSLRVRGLREAVEGRHMEWWHLPIPDLEPPGSDFERDWKIAGTAIRDRLRLGFDVLVHCRGGLGRAGTVAASLLVELGGHPDAAIRKVRKARPGTIQTPDQERHIQRCEPLMSPAPSTTQEAIRDRAVGAMLGLAVGDALGTTLEFQCRDERAEDRQYHWRRSFPTSVWLLDRRYGNGAGARGKPVGLWRALTVAI